WRAGVPPALTRGGEDAAWPAASRKTRITARGLPDSLARSPRSSGEYQAQEKRGMQPPELRTVFARCLPKRCSAKHGGWLGGPIRRLSFSLHGPSASTRATRHRPEEPAGAYSREKSIALIS